MGAAAGGRPVHAQETPPEPGPIIAPLRRYRLQETRRNQPWRPAPGRFGRAADVTSTPDGRVYALDDRVVAGRAAAVHVLDPTGRPYDHWSVQGQNDPVGAGYGWTPKRIDATPDGTLLVLLHGRSQAGGLFHVRVDHLDTEGRVLGRFQRALPLPEAYVDVAAEPEGGLVLARRGANPWCVGANGLPGRDGPGPSPYGIDRYGADALRPVSPDDGSGPDPGPAPDDESRPTRVLTPPELRVPLSLDVDAAGLIYVAQRDPAPCALRTGPPPTRPPGFGAARRLLPPSDASSIIAEVGGITGFTGIAEPETVETSQSLEIGETVETIDIAETAGRTITTDTRLTREGDGSVEGVLLLGPDGRVDGALPFAGPRDVAVGAAGLFVARHGELFAAQPSGAGIEDEPLLTVPLGRAPGDLDDPDPLRIDVRADGALVVSLDDCLAQGVLWIDADDVRRAGPQPVRARLIGAPDAPELEGPAWPRRLAADTNLAVLQGRLRISGLRPETQYEASSLAGHDGQAVQDWSADGTLRGQRAVCAGAGAWRARDVAVDGDRVFTLHADRVRLRPDFGFPAWTFWPDAEPLNAVDPAAQGRLQAIDARAGTVMALDQASGDLLSLDAQGVLIARISVHARPPEEERAPVAPGEPAPPPNPDPDPDPAAIADLRALPMDLALGRGEDAVFVALSGRGHVVVHAADGARRAAWPTRDAIRAIATGRGDEQDVFILGRGGWVYRHRPDGALVAAWPLPDPGVEATDLAVDRAGRVFVSWARLAPARNALEQRSTPIRGAGVWVFVPDDTSWDEAPRQASPPGSCLLVPDKRAAPPSLMLGDEVSVTLTIAGRCPEPPAPVDLVILLDASGSMAAGESDARALDALLTILAGLDPRAARVGLVTFAESVRVLQPPDHDLPAVAAAAARVRAAGASRLAAGLERTADLLSAERDASPERLDARRLVLLLTDGAIEDDPALWPAHDRLRAENAELHVLRFANEELDFRHQVTMRSLVVDEDRILSDPPDEAIRKHLFALTYRARTRGLLASARIVDVLPDDMAYVPDTARPPALYDTATRSLIWDVAARPGQPMLGAPTLTYRLRPLQAGLRPTNVLATAAITDALGQPATLRFPVPEVEVLAPRWTLHMPVLGRSACLRPPPALDVVITLDTSRSMDLPAGDPNDPSRSRLDAAREAVLVLAHDLAAQGDQPPGGARTSAHRIGVVAFHETAREVLPLGDDLALLRTSLAALRTAPGSRLDAGLRTAGAMIARSDRSAERVVVLLTDGRQGGGPAGARAARDAARALDARRITIGYGPRGSIDLSLLRDLAGHHDDAMYAPDSASLRVLAGRLAGRLACPDGAP